MAGEFNLARELLIATSFTIAFGLVFLLSEFVYKRYQVNVEYTRKLVHIGCGSIAMLLAIVQVHFVTIISLGIVFTILVWYMMKKKLLESVHAVKRKTYGSILFPSGVIACVIAGLKTDYGITFFIPLATMIYSDTIAAIVGVNYPLRQYKVLGYIKSVGGSVAFLVSAVIIFLSVIALLPSALNIHIVSAAIAFAFLTTVVEAISVKGWDDLTIPLASILFLYLTMK
jgi:phytol kinase